MLKMDIEGAEWDSLLATSDELLQGVNQISIEFHRTEDRKYIDLVRKLKKTFYVVDIHFNNFSCGFLLSPFPAWAYLR